MPNYHLFPGYLIKRIARTNKQTCAFVYFVSDGTAIKIGRAANLTARLSEIQVGNPRDVKLLFYIPTKSDTDASLIEAALHDVFRDSLIRGEWFDIIDVATKANLSDNLGIDVIECRTADQTTERQAQSVLQSEQAQHDFQKARPQYLTIRQAAQAFAFPEFRIRQMVKTNELPHFMAGSRAYINYDTLCKFLEGKA